MSQNNIRQGVKCLVFSILGMLCSLDFITTKYGLSKEGFPSPFCYKIPTFHSQSQKLRWIFEPRLQIPGFPPTFFWWSFWTCFCLLLSHC